MFDHNIRADAWLMVRARALGVCQAETLTTTASTRDVACSSRHRRALRARLLDRAVGRRRVDGGLCGAVPRQMVFFRGLSTPSQPELLQLREVSAVLVRATPSSRSKRASSPRRLRAVTRARLNILARRPMAHARSTLRYGPTPNEGGAGRQGRRRPLQRSTPHEPPLTVRGRSSSSLFHDRF